MHTAFQQDFLHNRIHHQSATIVLDNSYTEQLERLSTIARLTSYLKKSVDISLQLKKRTVFFLLPDLGNKFNKE